MGYYIQVINSRVRITKDNFTECLREIQKLHGQETIKDASGSHFSWVDNDFYKIENLDNILKEWRWVPEYDDIGNIENLEFIGEKYGDDFLLFNVIAKFMDNSSFIEFQGEDNSRWIWEFNNGQLIEKNGKTIYE